MSSPIRFAVIGTGHIGTRHADIIVGHAAAKLVAVADTNPDAYTKYKEVGIPCFNSIEAVLNSEEAFDVCSIASPNGLHAIHAIAALETGHHVVIEKPMALSTAESDRVLAVAHTVNKQVFCVMQNRYSPASQWLKEITANKILGRLYMVQVNCYWNRDDRYYLPNGWHGTKQLDGGVLFTQFSHFVDMLYWLFGDIEAIQSRFYNFNHLTNTEFDDSGIISFQFKQGGMGSFNFSTAVYDNNLESSITIIAEKGSIKVGGQYMNKVEYCHIKDYTMPELAATAPANDYGNYIGSAANHQYFYENLFDVLNNKAAVTTTGEEGRKVVEIIERMYKI